MVEDQVTYPLTTTMLSVPGARTVRGYSFFGDSYVYIIFDDKTDVYWARSRVLEYLNQVTARLPPSAKPTLGPDGTGVGWIYEYALVDHSGKYDISQLRALQDWFLKYELKSVPNVAEVASVGGLVKQYQVVLDPDRMRALGITIEKVKSSLRDSNNETGGSVLEMGEAEYAVRATGYLRSLDDFRSVPVGLGAGGTPILLGDVARVQIGPEIRRGISELDGKGEAVGGVIVMRAGKNALETIDAIKNKIASLQKGLPKGVEILATYDRSELIHKSVDTLRDKLIEEFIVVTLVCALFLFHLRSALVAIISLPLGILAAFFGHELAGCQCQHHVPGWNRDRHRRDGRCGRGYDRERAQTRGSLEPCQPRSPRDARRADAVDRRSGCRSGASALLQPVDHHPELCSRVHPRSPGGQVVRAAGVHQNLFDGGGRGVVGDP